MLSPLERAIQREKQARNLMASLAHHRFPLAMQPALHGKIRSLLIDARAFRLKARS